MAERKQIKVTQSLRDQWTRQKADMLEENAEDTCFEVALMDRLLSLPLGTKFNGMDVQDQMRAERAAS